LRWRRFGRGKFALAFSRYLVILPDLRRSVKATFRFFAFGFGRATESRTAASLSVLTLGAFGLKKKENVRKRREFA